MPYPWELTSQSSPHINPTQYSTPTAASSTPSRPLQSPAASSNPERHRHRHRARVYAHRVHESLSNRVVKCICMTFLSLLFVAGLITFILWLSLRPHRPRFHLASLQATDLFSDVPFNVSIRNPNRNIGIYYDDMQGSLFYIDQSLGTLHLLEPFYQPPKNTTSVIGRFPAEGSTTSDPGIRQRFADDMRAGTAVLRLQLTATIRFRVTTWDTQRHEMHVNCVVAVGRDGQALQESKDKRCPMYFT